MSHFDRVGWNDRNQMAANVGKDASLCLLPGRSRFIRLGIHLWTRHLDQIVRFCPTLNYQKGCRPGKAVCGQNPLLHRRGGEMEYLRIANWEKYQHYKNRNPRWVKLYIDTFNRPNWISLDDKSKFLLLICLGIGAICDGKVPKCAKTLQKISNLRRKPDLKPLIDIGFLLDDASTMLDREEKSKKKRRIREEDKKEFNELTEEEIFELKAMRQYELARSRSLDS